MKTNSDNVMRDALADMLSMLEYKVRNDALTSDDIHILFGAIEASGGVRATIRDIANYYGKKEVDVRNVICRNYLPKPTRRLYYDFGRFAKVAPKSWHEITSSLPAD